MAEAEMDLKGIIPFIAKFGLPPLILVFLIWFVVSKVEKQLNNIEFLMHAHQLDTSYYVKSVEELKVNGARQLKIMQQQCVNGAALRERPNCFQ